MKINDSIISGRLLNWLGDIKNCITTVVIKNSIIEYLIMLLNKMEDRTLNKKKQISEYSIAVYDFRITKAKEVFFSTSPTKAIEKIKTKSEIKYIKKTFNPVVFNFLMKMKAKIKGNSSLTRVIFFKSILINSF